MNHLPNYLVFLNFLPPTGDKFLLRAEAVGGGVTATQKSKLASKKSHSKLIPLIQCSKSIPNIIDMLRYRFERDKTNNTTEVENHMEEESLRDKSATIFGSIHFHLKLLGFSWKSWPMRHQYKNEFLLSFLYTALSSWSFFINHDNFFYSSFQIQPLVGVWGYLFYLSTLETVLICPQTFANTLSIIQI